MGTVYYMAPEQMRGDVPQTASDVFALGLIVFRWLYGKNLFEWARPIGEIVRQRIEQGINADLIRAHGASQSIATVLARMLHADPSERSGKYDDLFTDLRRALLETGSPLRDETFSRDVGQTVTTTSNSPGGQLSTQWDVAMALSENLTKQPPLRNFLHPLNREELDVGHRHPLGRGHRGRDWFGRDAEGAGLRLNWAGHGERLDEGVGISGIPGL